MAKPTTLMKKEYATRSGAKRWLRQFKAIQKEHLVNKNLTPRVESDVGGS